MRGKKFGWIGASGAISLLATATAFSQGTLFVDQASGTTDEFLGAYTGIPNNQIAQSFTPSLSAVGFVQFSTYTLNDNNGSGVLFAVNLRQGAYTGPVVSSTTPVLIVRGPIQISTLYFPDNIPVTAGQSYYFEPVLLSAGDMAIGYKFPSSYPGGEAWNNGVPSGNSTDFWFREGVVGVPEPGKIWVGLIGFTVLLSRRAPRKRQ